MHTYERSFNRVSEPDGLIGRLSKHFEIGRVFEAWGQTCTPRALASPVQLFKLLATLPSKRMMVKVVEVRA